MMTMKMFPKKLSIKLTQYKKMKEILSAVNEEHGDRMASAVSLPVSGIVVLFVDAMVTGSTSSTSFSKKMIAFLMC